MSATAWTVAGVGVTVFLSMGGMFLYLFKELLALRVRVAKVEASTASISTTCEGRLVWRASMDAKIGITGRNVVAIGQKLNVDIEPLG